MATQTPVSAARERILTTAHDLFYSEGVRATGIDRVIAESDVTKVTFYRHFPSKNDLVRAFLDYRHERWMNWFVDALARYGAGEGKMAAAVIAAMQEWFESKTFRGCAFINSVVELGGSLPDVLEVSRGHKQSMVDAIARYLPTASRRAGDAVAIAVAIDGAIIRAQYDETPKAALKALKKLLAAFTPVTAPAR
ncbi:TetR/AcrR family transcriptional regulator [Dyella sp. GSA-30]|uniref:TetR/AcrR family transcriptional regulator n=1 Tax=Dyella sp. GSA-30 TaxID=2994496 RepID=UPI0024924346|nr:TetR/AcrR family transcriptional regulator [Dyella sp. GSA-30]BDU23014.1 TetR family transcriptional regulator [Dyella sp. GSA-30]